MVVFCENGVIPLIILPGDGFLFALGVVAKAEAVEFWFLWPLLILGAVLGYQFNYWTGANFGVHLLKRRNWVKEKHLKSTQKTFDLHGKKAVFICRFIPVARTVTPFLAGLAQMPKSAFRLNNMLGGSIWISLVFLTGYFLGAIPFVRENFVWLFFALITFTTSISLTGIFIHKRKSLKGQASS